MASSKGKNAANIVTICRIICSLIILFLQPFSLSFYIVYILAGLTDIFDGMIARRMQTESELGAKLDSIADFIFVAVCLIKILPAISVPKWLWIWIGVIAAIKIINVISGYVIYKKMVVEHTLMNKVSGLVLFVLPISFAFIDLKYSAGVVGVIVLVFIVLAAIQSSYLRWDYNNPEFAVAGTILHGFEFIFVRLAPLAFIASVIGIVITYKKR